MTSDKARLQCHVCGGLFTGLAFHAFSAHGLKADEYRERYGLSRTTALVSEVERERMKSRGREMWEGIPVEERLLHLATIRSLRKSTKGMRHSLESRNKNGTCPDQLLKSISDVRGVLGRIPSLREYRVWSPRHKTLVNCIYSTFGSWNRALKLATGEINEKQNTRKWTDNELLEHLRIFYKTHNTIPTKSDSRRGFIPSKEVYRKHFGGLPAARVLAGIK